MAILIIGREFAISGLRSIAAAEGYVIKASELGKTKLVFQVFAISLVMVALRWSEWAQAATVAMWIVVVLTMWSAISYFRKFWREIDIRVKRRRRHELLILERTRRQARREAGVKG